MINYAKRFIANPHTEFSHFGKYSTQMMHYAENSLLNRKDVISSSTPTFPGGGTVSLVKGY